MGIGFVGRSSWSALWIALVASGAAAQEVRGRVVDAAGKPAAGARVCREWRFPDPMSAAQSALPEPSGLDDLHKPLLADERGEFVGPMADVHFLLAFGADGKSGVLAPVDETSSAPLELTLVPLVEVRGRFDVKTPGEPPKKTALWVSAGTGMPGFVAECISEGRAFRVSLPAGTYSLWYSTDAVNLYSMSQLREEPLVIQPGQSAIDLGALELDLPLVLHPQGVVHDTAGKPTRASLGESWATLSGQMSPWDGFESDESGHFRGSIEVYDVENELALLVLDQKREQAALAFWKPKEAETPLEIRLAPAVHVSGSYRTSTGTVPAWTNTYVYVARSGGDKSRAPRVAQCQSKEGRFEFRLPPGTYRLNGYGTDTKSTNVDLVLAADALERDLGVIELPQTVIARNKGKDALPWHVTDARGLAQDVKLSDFCGKWVLLEFWGFW